MKKYFDSGVFNSYKVNSLNSAMGDIQKICHTYGQAPTTVFISHKHDDLGDLKGLIGFLEKNYNIKAYIDSKDPAMPKVTSGETAKRIKDRMNQCEKFILLATEGAIESKWCNWELGYGDATKLEKNSVALFPIKEKSKYFYSGNEYLEIYPHIVRAEKGDYYMDGKPIKEGYYVRYRKGDVYSWIPLQNWLK